MSDKEQERSSTSSLMRKLTRAKKIDSFFAENETQFGIEDFQNCLKKYCEAKNTIPEHVITRAQIDRTYGHQLFNGTRNPSRDKVIQLAFGLGLNVEETQHLLRAASKSTLYPRIRRDAVIIYALKEKWSLLETQEALSQYNLTILGEEKIYG